MDEPTKDEIIDDFVGILNQIDNKSSDEIESSLQKIIQRIRPLLHDL